MNRPVRVRVFRRRGFAGLGYPILPDTLVSASGVSWSFSPQTPDQQVLQVLQQAGQSLPADLAAKMAAQAGASSPAVTPSGAPISTQTGAPVSLVNTIAIAPGVFRCNMSDGSSHYCDGSGNAMSYTPPAATPTITPAAGSMPTAVVSPSVQQSQGATGLMTPGMPGPGFLGPPIPAPAPPVTDPPAPPAAAPPPGVTASPSTIYPLTPPAVTPSGSPLSTTTGQPVTTTPAATPAAAAPAFDFSAITTWLTGTMIGGIPNWVLVGGAAFLMFGMGGNSSRKR